MIELFGLLESLGLLGLLGLSALLPPTPPVQPTDHSSQPYRWIPARLFGLHRGNPGGQPRQKTVPPRRRTAEFSRRGGGASSLNIHY